MRTEYGYSETEIVDSLMKFFLGFLFLVLAAMYNKPILAIISLILSITIIIKESVISRVLGVILLFFSGAYLLINIILHQVAFTRAAAGVIPSIKISEILK